MKTLVEHDAERHEWYFQFQKLSQPRPNGIECPKCKTELWDSNPDFTLTSNPPRKTIHCPACGYGGSRIA